MSVETWDAKVKRLRALTVEPERLPMGRSQQWPTMAAKHIANEQEIVTLRSALREAIAIIDTLQGPWAEDMEDDNEEEFLT